MIEAVDIYGGKHRVAMFHAVSRLYSSANYNDNFVQHADPEILRTPLEGVALVMKAMGIDKV